MVNYLPPRPRAGHRSIAVAGLLGFLGLVGSFGVSVDAHAARAVPELTKLVSWMSGSFSSARQAAADSAFYDIRLTMAPIWIERTDGCWLYVEQATAGAIDKPYRQRVYQVLELAPGVFESRVFKLPGEARFIGAGQDSALGALTPDSLDARTGCAIELRPRGEEAFVGSTRDKQCPSDLRGAAYATSEVEIRADRLVSWDRGYDTADEQVWGAEKGGYIFEKIPRLAR